ncbi:NfeD family protein [Sphingomonadaceae bacterium OTU29MARTA1]|uniref:NfeD family protein n=1 Tax=Sphingomonas sp. Leaf37 TaxID=2876552 RepID=UPI001E595E21|nr:NfeD family protein [Sphingomonas sp. Leaf37]USU05729.1 NfeD family protein [Sphingomonadaceae bacterium OTU29LAMAA1]USU09211.1 NfeD family protein [Sphingomonadaceae bacterium OTU29MARTA1]USU12609.1 NfeD family protein [Sphingomonadaceae bacterium OTU29THOMA1]
MTLDSIGGAGGAWLIAALLLGLAELLIPGVFAIFLAIAAGIVGVATLALPLPLEAQIAAFAVWSVVTVLIGKRWYVDFPVASSDPQLNDRAARMIGQTVVVEVPIDADGGRVHIGDGSWPARGTPAAAGTRVRIAEVRGGLVIVEPLDV